MSVEHEYTYKEALLVPAYESTGYLHVVLVSKRGEKGKFFKIHQLVAAAFLGFKLGSSADQKDKAALVIDHINKRRDDNRVENLQLITKLENSQQFHIFGYADITKGDWVEMKEEYMDGNYLLSRDGKVCKPSGILIGDINNGRPYFLVKRLGHRKCYSIKKMLEKYF